MSAQLFLGHLRFFATCHAAGYPSGVSHLADSGWLPYSCGDGLTWGWGCLSTNVLLPLGFLPCACAASPSGFCTLDGCVSMSDSSLLVFYWVWVGGFFAAHLVFSHLLCSSSGPAACAAFPAAGYLRVFRSLGVCPSASLVTWVGLQPFPSFSGLLLLCLLAEVVGVLHPVSGCSSCGVVCLVCR